MDYEDFGMSRRAKTIITIIVTAIVSILATFGITVSVQQPEVRTEIKTVTETVESGLELSTEQLPAFIDDARGEAKPDYNVPTIEEVDGGRFETDEPEDTDTSARGEFYRTDTYLNFISDTRDKCVVMGNRYGAQCVSLAQAFATNYGAGRLWSTCGTGAAYGLWDCRVQNAGDDYMIIEDAKEVQAGDWIITYGGQYGHVAMAVGPYSAGYVAVYGENQGGVACPQGGSQPNIINLSMKNFRGAFRPKSYIIITPPDTGVAK